MINKILSVFVLSLLMFGLSFSIVLAEGGSTPASTGGSSKTVSSVGNEIGKQFAAVNTTAGYDAPTDPRTIAARVIKTILNFLGIIFLGLIVYAGFLWMTAGGNEERIEKSKKLLYRSVVGLLIILAAYSITWAAFKIALGYSDEFNTGVYTQPKYR